MGLSPAARAVLTAASTTDQSKTPGEVSIWRHAVPVSHSRMAPSWTVGTEPLAIWLSCMPKKSDGIFRACAGDENATTVIATTRPQVSAKPVTRRMLLVIICCPPVLRCMRTHTRRA